MKRRAILFVLAPALLSFAGCGSSETAGKSVLDPLDFELPADAADFDADNVMSSAVLKDTSAATLPTLDAFFANSPYESTSFLGAYRAGSTSASAAVMQASMAYHVNPAALLARMEMEQGLVALTRYPPTASRVEYVFRCGCAGDECDPALAGLDKQLNCLAFRWAASLERVSSEGATLGGWSVALEKETADGVPMTPKNAATCVIVDDLGEVGDGTRGTSLFYAIFERYRAALLVTK